ncbi:MAG: M1 family metallopeptidase [Anaerolineae bacterium]
MTNKKLATHRASRIILFTILLLLVAGCGPSPTPTVMPPPTTEPTLNPTPTTAPQPTSSPPTAVASTSMDNLDDLTLYEAAMLPQFANDIAQLDDPTQYHIDLVVDVETLTLTGSQRVLYTNNETDTLGEIYFRLFPNTPDYGGWLSVERITVNGQQRGVTYELSDTAMKVLLAEPLAPEAQLEIVIDFWVVVPEANQHGYGALNYENGIMSLAGFYPLVPVYDDEGWNVELAPDYGDAVYSDAALYNVHLTVPLDMVVATSGSVVSETDNDDGTRTLRCVSGPMRDFNVVMSRDFVVKSTTVGQTTVNSFYLSMDEAAGERVLRYVGDALRIYNERFGLYPFTEFDVIEAPITAAGIEYPGLIVIAQRFYQEGQEGGFFEFATAHEVAHQWWYSMVGSDQVDEPWLDEALTSYSTLIYFEDIHGQQEAQSILAHYFEGPYQQMVKEGRDAAVAQPVVAFSEEDYATIVYGKGPLFFHALRQEVGDETYFAIMREYLRQHKYKIATPESLMGVAESVSGRDLDAIYKEWVLSTKRP